MNLGGSRHYFFRISESGAIAFFEFKDVEEHADNSPPARATTRADLAQAARGALCRTGPAIGNGPGRA
jgi:hypothetical protein